MQQKSVTYTVAAPLYFPCTFDLASRSEWWAFNSPPARSLRCATVHPNPSWHHDQITTIVFSFLFLSFSFPGNLGKLARGIRGIDGITMQNRLKSLVVFINACTHVTIPEYRFRNELVLLYYVAHVTLISPVNPISSEALEQRYCDVKRTKEENSLGRNQGRRK